MKGYYKNWYQHYLEVEEQKEQDMKRGYYSNLTPKEEDHDKHNKYGKHIEKKSDTIMENENPTLMIQTIEPPKKKRKKRVLLNIFLPAITVAGFIFFWYQADIGPTRDLVNEVLVFAGLRSETVDVISYHTNLLDQHLEFVEKISLYINSEDELNFSDLELMFNDLRQQHFNIVEMTEDAHIEVLNLWSSKMAHTGQMMVDLIADDQRDIIAIHEQFLIEQEEIAAMIIKELES